MTSRLRIARVDVFPWNLAFKRPAKTSRDTLTHKPSWFIKLTDENGREGWGECSIIPGLSLDESAAIAAFFSKAQTDPPQRAEEIPEHLTIKVVMDHAPHLRYSMEKSGLMIPICRFIACQRKTENSFGK